MKVMNERVMKMLLSADQEINSLGSITAAGVLESWKDYNLFRQTPHYKDISNVTRKQIRKAMESSCGRLPRSVAKQYKTW